MSALPFPTKHRLALADAVAAGKVQHYPFVQPATFNAITGNLVTSRVKELHAAGPVSTSPETGPERSCGGVDRAHQHCTHGPRPLDEAPTLTEIVEFLDPDGALRAESTKDEERTEGGA